MRVAENHHVRSFARDAHFQFVRPFARLDDVLDEKFSRRQCHDLRFTKIQAAVRVSQNRGDGRDLFQFKRDERRADVARVQNMIHAREKFGNFRVEKIVCVRNDADFHWRCNQ